MSLAAGSRLGPYEILSSLGSGGMGEVHRTRDARLGRDVAIKILPHHLAADHAAVARFEQEGVPSPRCRIHTSSLSTTSVTRTASRMWSPSCWTAKR